MNAQIQKLVGLAQRPAVMAIILTTLTGEAIVDNIFPEDDLRIEDQQEIKSIEAKIVELRSELDDLKKMHAIQ